MCVILALASQPHVQQKGPLAKSMLVLPMTGNIYLRSVRQERSVLPNGAVQSVREGVRRQRSLHPGDQGGEEKEGRAGEDSCQSQSLTDKNS